MRDSLLLFWPLFGAMLAGAGIGLFYFGGLWLTVNRLTKTNRPGALFLMSFIFRTVVSMLGFYVVMDGQWQRAAALVTGFLLARLLSVRYWGIAPQGG